MRQFGCAVQRAPKHCQEMTHHCGLGVLQASARNTRGQGTPQEGGTEKGFLRFSLEEMIWMEDNGEPQKGRGEAGWGDDRNTNRNKTACNTAETLKRMETVGVRCVDRRLIPTPPSPPHPMCHRTLRLLQLEEGL